MARIVLACLLLVWGSGIASAQSSRVDAINIIEYGIYTADRTNCHRDQLGVQRCDRSNIRHAATTTTVPAELGTHFGVRYQVTGSPSGVSVPIKVVWLSPPLHSPTSAQPVTSNGGTWNVKIGDTTLQDYSFDDTWELVPGFWTVQLWSGDRKLAEQQFTVVAK